MCLVLSSLETETCNASFVGGSKMILFSSVSFSKKKILAISFSFHSFSESAKHTPIHIVILQASIPVVHSDEWIVDLDSIPLQCLFLYPTLLKSLSLFARVTEKQWGTPPISSYIQFFSLIILHLSIRRDYLDSDLESPIAFHFRFEPFELVGLQYLEKHFPHKKPKSLSAYLESMFAQRGKREQGGERLGY